jgi:ABC-type sugar transport system permease subunit
MTNLRKREALWGYLFLAPSVVMLLVFVGYPTLVGLHRSFTDWNFLTMDQWQWIGLLNYTHVLGDPVFWLTLKNLLFIFLGKMVLQVGGGLLLANTLQHYLGSKLRRVFRTIYFTPAVVAPIAVGLLWSYIFEPDFGLVSKGFASLGIKALAVPWLGDIRLSLVGLILVDTWESIPFAMVLFLAGIQSIPEEQYEAAKMDGAGGWQLLRYITVPGLRTVISVTAIIVTINAIKLFDLARSMTLGGPNHHTETPSTWLFQIGINQHDLGYACALAVVILAMCLVLTIFELRIFESQET